MFLFTYFPVTFGMHYPFTLFVYCLIYTSPFFLFLGNTFLIFVYSLFLNFFLLVPFVMNS